MITIEELYSLYRGCSEVTTDSRNITEGSIFFALRGESFDGNSYAVEALAKGADYSVVDSLEVWQSVVGSVVEGRIILVDDVLETLQALARHHRRSLPIEILAVTGSNGKTTTKELLSEVLRCKYRLFATRGNFNNHIGVPLTLLSFDERKCDGDGVLMGVVEMGASSRGEIALLCSIAEPNFGVITNIGLAHLEGFGGAEGVAKGKGELVDYLDSVSGEFFVADENEAVKRICDDRQNLTLNRYSYHLADGVESNLEGAYNHYNIATAVAIGERFGVDEGDIVDAIAQYKATNNRSQRMVSECNSLIIDCYNANPSSMAVAIANLAEHRGVSRVAILGDMYELGDWSEVEHLRILRLAVDCGIEKIVVVGDRFTAAQRELCVEGVECYSGVNQLVVALEQTPIVGQLVLLKGSRSVGLERLIKFL